MGFPLMCLQRSVSVTLSFLVNVALFIVEFIYRSLENCYTVDTVRVFIEEAAMLLWFHSWNFVFFIYFLTYFFKT